MDRWVHRILVATDLSEASPRLLQVAKDVAAQFSAEIIVLNVFDPVDYVAVFQANRLPLDDYMNKLRAELWYQLAPGPGQPGRAEVVQGRNVAQGILDAAVLASVDLIVMGTHGRTGLRRVMLGSVAEEVLRHAHCPVLVVPLVILARAAKAAKAPEPAVVHG